MKKRLSTTIAYIAPAILVLIIDCIVLGVQGIWPFGSTTIDYYDMGQQLASEYIHIYDELHGSKSMIFDWYSCLGRGIPGTTYLSIFNLYLFLLPRNMILQGFSVAFIFKTMCMAIAMRIFLKKEISSCPDFYSIILSAGYGLCGFTLMQYTIIAWFDVAIAVPLVMMFAKRLIRDGKVLGYIISISYMLLVSFYLPVMCLLFIFLMTGVYICASLAEYYLEGKTFKGYKRQHYILRLGLATLGALMLSAFIWIPKVLEASGSQRFNNEAESGLLAAYTKIITHVRPDYATRWWCLLGASFGLSVIFLGLLRDIKNKNKKRLIIALGSMMLLILELIFENIQLFWHFGSYVNYPVRNGFLMYFVIAALSADYLKEVLGDEADSNIPAFYSLGGIIVGILLSGAGIFWYMSNPGMSVYTVFRVTAICAMVCFFVYLFILRFKNGRYSKLCIFLIIAELIFYGVLLIGKPTFITGYSEEPEQDGEYIKIADTLDRELDILSSRIDRIKNPDTSLNTNYGNFLERATLSGWVPSIAPDVIRSAYVSGYSTQYTRVLDSGGNAFTDALLHITQTVSLLKQDSALYNEVGSASAVVDSISGATRDYYLYDNKYVLPYGIIVSDIEKLNKIASAGNSFDFTNAAYDAIAPEGGVIAERIDMADTEGLGGLSSSDSEEILENAVVIKGKKLLYITGYCTDAEYANVRILVNGRAVGIPTLGDPNNTYYPAHFNNNLVYLGCFEDEEVRIKTEYDLSKEGPIYSFDLYAVDVNKLSELCSYYKEKSKAISVSLDKRSINVNAHFSKEDLEDRSGNNYLLLPTPFTFDFTAQNNGNRIDLIPVGGLMMAVPLAKGDNNITITYFSGNMKLGICVSILGLIALIGFYALLIQSDEKGVPFARKIIGNMILQEDKSATVFTYLYLAVFGVAMLLIYVLPVIYGLYYYVSMIL